MRQINTTSAGVYVIAVTPFTPAGGVDLGSIDTMVDFYLDRGVDGLTILGMMGEAPKLTHAESLMVAERVLARAGGRPVVVGVSAPGLASIRELSVAVMERGAAGVMVAPPGNLRTAEQIIAYYGNVAATLGPDIPVCLQDFPQSTGVHISPATLVRLFEANPSIVMLKHEDYPGLEKITALRAAEAEGARRVSILCGNGGLFLPEEMGRGADGAMTGFGFPEMMVEVVRLARAGASEQARDLFDAYLPLARYELQPGPGIAVRKYVLARRGAIACDAQRSPGVKLSPRARAEVDALLARQTAKLAALG